MSSTVIDDGDTARTYLSAQYITEIMDDIDPDTIMMAAGIVLSLIALFEIYPNWRGNRERPRQR